MRIYGQFWDYCPTFPRLDVGTNIFPFGNIYTRYVALLTSNPNVVVIFVTVLFLIMIILISLSGIAKRRNVEEICLARKCSSFVEDWDIYRYGDWLPYMNRSGSMMTSSNGNIFRVTGHLCGEFTGPRWIPHTKARDAELWYLLWSAPE